MQTDPEKTSSDSLLNRWLNREKKNEVPKGVEPRPEGVQIPLSPGQQRLLFLQQLYPGNPFYNYADAYRFRGRLRIDHLIESFELIFRRHDIFRTTFQIEGDQAVQKIHERPEFELSRRDLRKVPDGERFEKARKTAIEESRRSFNLAEGPLTRVSIIQLAEEDFMVVLTMHHIIFDKWSTGLLLDELAGTYRALCSGEPYHPIPADLQYADFAYWQKGQKTDSENLSYWMKKLAGSEVFLDLPTDFQRPPQQTFRGAYSSRPFPAGLSQKIKEFCRQTGTTPYVFLLTAYQILLSRYSGETDILVGSPFTNRDRVELEKLIGFFNDTLVLRSDLSPEQTFTALLDQVRQTTHDAFTHKNMPLETLVRSLKPERYINYNPLFQVMFIYHETPRPPSFGEDLTVVHEPLDFGVAKFDLTLYISDQNDRLSGTFEYAADLFEEGTVERMHGHLHNLLAGIVENPDRRISELPLITDEEIKEISGWNEKTSFETGEVSVNELFAEQVRSNPERKAVSFEGESLTYRELDERANSIANYLLTLDLKENEPVGLFVERSVSMVAGIFGILKAGMAYLPLDAGYPPERIRSTLEDAQVSVLLTGEELSGRPEDDFFRIHRLEEIIASSPVTEPVSERRIGKDDLAYLIYTSGSTGRPKGVPVNHKNLLSSTAARFDFYKEKPKNFLLLSSFSFDSSVAGIFWTLTTGGNLVVARRRIEQDMGELAELIVNEQISHTLILPTLYGALLENIESGRMRSLETVIVAGEACPASLCRKHFEHLPEVELCNEYGPTEATVWATVHRLRPEDAEGVIPIGKPIANTQIHILDEDQKPVPVGVKGEIHIAGEGVVNGYFNKPDLSAKFFIQNPFGDGTDKMYRTGDRGRYRSDGTIEFSGRTDDQIKIRGYRIEPGEIQETIKSHPAVRDVVVKLESYRTGNDAQPTADHLSQRLRALDSDEALEILASVEGLSDSEVKFILSEMERG